MKRRAFIKNGGFLTIGFMMGRSVVAEQCDIASVYIDGLPQSIQRTPEINAWIRITEKGRVQVFTGKMELGQGIRTAIAQVAAEELYMPVDKVDVTIAETGVTPDEGYTAGSGSIDNSAMSVRYAAAAAREKLMQLASAELNIRVDKLEMEDGIIRGIAAGERNKSITITKLLAGKQVTDRVTEKVTLKDKSAYKLVGKPVKRNDIYDMVAGKSVYLQDLRFPGMLHARIIRPPVYLASLENIDEAAIKTQFPSLLKLVVDGSFIGVITSDEFAAVRIQNVGEIFCRWKSPAKLPAGNDVLKTFLQQLPVKHESVKTTGTVNISSKDGALVHSAEYYKPYMMHGSIGPSCSIAIYSNDKLTIWSHSQGIYPLRETIAKMLNIAVENIRIIGVPGSGCYGHNGADDVSAEAAILAIAYPGQYIRLQWSRADEHAWEPYGSAMIMQIKAVLAKNGMITDWQYKLWSDTHATRPGGNPENLLPANYIRKSFPGKSSGFSGGAYRNSEPYYDIPNQQIDAYFFDGPLRVSALRSLGAYGNIFAIESFMDELAEKAKKDPFDFRLMHLKDERAKAVLIKLRDMVKDHKPDVKGSDFSTGIGIAFSRYKNTAAYCAVGASVACNRLTGETSILKMFSAIDAGEAINTDSLINQTEGGLIQAASWTMQEEVKFSAEKILSTDWKSYPIFRFSQVPDTEVAVLINPDDGPMGAGEAAQGPAGAAVVNAIYRASGKRFRDLPVAPVPLPKE